jgi:hypothetical protein
LNVRRPTAVLVGLTLTLAPSVASAQEGTTEHKDTIAYAGVSLGVSLPAVWGGWGEAFQLGFRLGADIDGLQLQLDVSPATTLFTNITSSAFASFDAVGTIGYLLPLNDFTSWVLRVGGGGGAFIGPTSAPIGFGEFRVDVFGVEIRTSKHLLVECNIPSFRVLFLTPYPGSNSFAMMWVTNVSLEYVF